MGEGERVVGGWAGGGGRWASWNFERTGVLGCLKAKRRLRVVLAQP